MVGESRSVLEEILTEKQIHHILKRAIGEDINWVYNGGEITPPMDGIAGFLSDHMKIVLKVKVGTDLKKIHLFLKRIPANNGPKAEYINQSQYFKRETLMFKVLEEVYENDPSPWSVYAYIYTDSMIVMPDLTFHGYIIKNFLETLDVKHMFIATKSIARFHAAIVNYETKKSIDLKRPYTIYQEFSEILTEPTLCDSLWLRASSKLSANIIKIFSAKSYRMLPELELKLTELYLKACGSLMEYEDTFNVLIHKDLWINNLLFKYHNNVPTNAVIIDYQCLRYGPPTFDLMLFLYLTTDNEFRDNHEKEILNYYYKIFAENLKVDSQERMNKLGYDRENFLLWCEKARMFGIFAAIAFYPYVLMDPKTAAKTFDNPDTYEKHAFQDRSQPVIAHANNCHIYRRRNLQVTEEFVERYLLPQL